LRALSARFSAHVVERATDEDDAYDELRRALAVARLMQVTRADASADEVARAR